MNEKSSRSHHVFQIKIHTFNKYSKPVESLLNVVDLAGSERRSAYDSIQDQSISITKRGKVSPDNSGQGSPKAAYQPMRRSKLDSPEKSFKRGTSFIVNPSAEDRRMQRQAKRTHGS
jgi:hypothetical protein